MIVWCRMGRAFTFLSCAAALYCIISLIVCPFPPLAAVLPLSSSVLAAQAAVVTDLAAVNEMLEAAAARYDLPAVLLKAIAFQESAWHHHWQPGDLARGVFDESSHVRYWGSAADPAGYVKIRREPPGPSFPHGAFGIGLMQITIPLNAAGEPADPQRYARLKDDLAYNISEACRHLLRFFDAEGDKRYLIENWWYTTYRYNGFGSRAKLYSERVRQLVAAPPAQLRPFMEPLRWTLPWEVKPDFDIGSQNRRATEPFHALAHGVFVFDPTGRPNILPAQVNFWQEPSPEFGLLIRGVQGRGEITVQPSSPSGLYARGVELQLTAEPAPGWEFAGWLDSRFTAAQAQSNSAAASKDREEIIAGHLFVEALFVREQAEGMLTTALSGTVLGDGVYSPAGIRVLLFRRRDQISYSLASTTVDSAGHFDFGLLHLELGGEYFLRFRPDSSHQSYYLATELELDIGTTTPEHYVIGPVHLSMGACLHLSFQDFAGAAVAQQRLQIFDGRLWGSYRTNDEGDLYLGLVPQASAAVKILVPDQDTGTVLTINDLEYHYRETTSVSVQVPRW